MTNHTGHTHPSTKAARAACRRGTKPAAVPTKARPFFTDRLAVRLCRGNAGTKHSFVVISRQLDDAGTVTAQSASLLRRPRQGPAR